MVKDHVIRAHLAHHDPILFSLLKTVTLPPLSEQKPSEFFSSLCREIIGQQLSGRVADVIFDRFARLFPHKRIRADDVRYVSDEQLRTTGMSWSKVGFIRDLSEKVSTKKVDLSLLTDMHDEKVVSYLTNIKGIGPWTAEMFLIFALGRKDVFSYGDLGLRKAMQKLYSFKNTPTQKQMERIVVQWKPFRTYGARLLWKYLEMK